MVILRVAGGGGGCGASSRGGDLCGSYLMGNLDRGRAGCDGVRGARSFDGRGLFCRWLTVLWVAEM